MDEKSPQLKSGDILPATDQVYRIVLATDRDRKNKKIPAIRCFSLSAADENKLSVDWDKQTTPEECIARTGATFKMNTENYKQYEDRELFALDISFLDSLQDVEKVVYDPVLYDIPIKGRVNNPSHSLMVFDKEFAKDRARQPEIVLKIRNHAANKKVAIDWDKVHELVKKYRLESFSC